MNAHTVLGGTFDHIHDGHTHLLQTAFLNASHVTIGLTDPRMNTKKQFSHLILPYEVRKKELEDCIVTDLKHSHQTFTIVPIIDSYGPTLHSKEFTSIVVTPHTKETAEKINAKRKEIGLPSLTIQVCELLSDQQGNVLSSTRIRSGAVNRHGFVYSSLFITDISASPQLRARVKQTLGTSYDVFPNKIIANKNDVCYVGDIVTQTALTHAYPFLSAWIDGVSARKPHQLNIASPYVHIQTECINPAGTIDHTTATYMFNHIADENRVFQILGEEDLLTLVVILAVPLGSTVVYGNPFGQKGVTVVEVAEAKKEEILSLIEANV